MKRIITGIISLFATTMLANAVSAYPGPITVSQPDGTKLVIRMHGDEYLGWATCGNSLVAKGSDGYWRYASFNADGSVKAEGARVTSTGSGDGSSVKPPVSMIKKALASRQVMNSEAKTASEVSHPISTGEKHFLILLIEFSDKKFTMPKSSFTDMLSSDNYTYNGAVGSVKKYYNDVSFGKFSPQFDVYGPIPVSGTSAQYAQNDVDAVKEACTYAHDSLGVDFSNYCIQSSSYVDNVFFFFPGYNQAEGGGSDCIWPHAVTYYSPFMTLDGVGIYRYGCTSEFKEASGGIMAGIGTFSHEFGHILGLPDLYDTDYSTNGQGSALQTLSLMSNGNYNNQGRTPPYLTYEEKLLLGWDNGLTELSAGSNTLVKTSENVSYYNSTPTEGEYYLYESRPCLGWDAYTNAPGLAIYHVDKSDYVMPSGYTAAQHWSYQYLINAYADHQCMDLVESIYPESELSYNSQLVFPGYNSVTSFTSGTLPAAKAWSGEDTGFNINNISFNSTTGTTTFTVVEEIKLTGNITDVSGSPIAGAAITATAVTVDSTPSVSTDAGEATSVRRVQRLSSAKEYTAVSNESGHFEIEGLSDGNYTISVKKEGYVQYSDVCSVKAVTGIDITLLKPNEKAQTVLQKYSELSDYAYGYGSAGYDIYAGLRYYSYELTDYIGDEIASVSFMACDGGTGGAADKIGVQVYFGNDLQCDCECATQVFGTICTVDLSSYKLAIPSGKSVTFSFYVLNPPYGWPLALADLNNPKTGGNLYRSSTSNSWRSAADGNFVISAAVTDKGKVIDLSGFNYIPRSYSSYKIGDSFDLRLVESSVNHPSSVKWSVNGEDPGTDTITFSTAGIYIIRAFLTYSSGRTETVETKINVTQ